MLEAISLQLILRLAKAWTCDPLWLMAGLSIFKYTFYLSDEEPCDGRLPRPQCALEPQVQGLHVRSEATDDIRHQTRDEAPRGDRTRRRPPQKKEHRMDRNCPGQTQADSGLPGSALVH